LKCCKGFNVIAYSDGVRALFDGLVEASDANVSRAMEDVDRIDASGGTAIYDALQAALGQWAMLRERGAGRPKYVIFLTDGQPTIPAHNRPETIEEDVILRETAKANDLGARIFAFGVGYDVNIRLLDKLVGDNHGRGDYVKPNEPIESKVASLYNKIKNPVMTNLAVKLHGVRVYDMYPREIGDLFEGDQIVVAGRYDARDIAKLPSREDGAYPSQLVITGQYEGKTRGFEYPVMLMPNTSRLGFDFVEKIWAVRRVGFLMDQIQLNGRSEELVDELVRLSRTYGIMTPYTSFLADETTPLHSPVAVREKASEEADRLTRDVGGMEGQMAAETRQRLNESDVAMAKSAPSPTAAPGRDAPADLESAGYMFGNDNKKDYEAGERQRVAGMRNVGNQAVYQRGRVWVAANAADVDLEKEAENVQLVERFSEAYFDLVRANTKLENEVMASQGADEELVIRLRDQVYRIR
jgi:Ca-activated chloride channel family protein